MLVYKLKLTNKCSNRSKTNQNEVVWTNIGQYAYIWQSKNNWKKYKRLFWKDQIEKNN